MKKFQIVNLDSGTVLGVYEGENEKEALDAMARDAGYFDYHEACNIYDAPFDDSEIRVTEVK